MSEDQKTQIKNLESQIAKKDSEIQLLETVLKEIKKLKSAKARAKVSGKN